MDASDSKLSGRVVSYLGRTRRVALHIRVPAQGQSRLSTVLLTVERQSGDVGLVFKK